MRTSFSRAEIHAMARPWLAGPRPPAAEALGIHTDTSDFFRVDAGEVVLLDGTPYLVRNSVREGRFGLDDEVKHWVKRAIELPTGKPKILKLVFHERFTANIGGIAFECFRSPRKEARILKLVAGHPNFMQGTAVEDAAGNIVRVLEVISGASLADRVAEIPLAHEAYFHEALPEILGRFIGCIEAIRFLHRHGEKHGDIRRDHILIDRDRGDYRWIDFDYNYRHRENIYAYDLFGLGNILIYVVGKGDLLLPDLRRERPEIAAGLSAGDMNIVFHNRLANLKRVYAYLPEALNRVLLHFSAGANWFYETTDQLLQELGEAAAEIR
jgi:hypothetical protein